MTTEANDIKLVPADVARDYAAQLRLELVNLAEAAERIATMARLVQINAASLLDDLARQAPDNKEAACDAAK